MIPSVVVTILLIWAIINLGTWLLPQALLFHPEYLPDEFNYKFEHPFDEVFIDTGCGRINALHFKENKPSDKGVVLFFHGNAGNLAHWGSIHENFTALGYDVFIYDYGGYGKSTGKLTEKCLYDETIACYNHLLKEYPAEKIILYGRSLGGAMATFLGAHKNVAKVILEAPFASVPDVFYQYFPGLPRVFFFRYRFPNLKWIQKVKAPAYIIHGTNDSVVPIKSSGKLKPHLSSEKYYITIEGGDHNNLATFKEYHGALKAILDSARQVKSTLD